MKLKGKRLFRRTPGHSCQPGIKRNNLQVLAGSYHLPSGLPAPLIKRNDASFILVGVAGVEQAVLALRQVQLVKGTTVAKAHDGALVSIGEFVTIVLLSWPIVHAETEMAALMIEQGLSSSGKVCVTAQFAGD